MPEVPAVVVLVLAALAGVLLGSLVRRRRRRLRAEAAVRRSRPLPRAPLRSQVIVTVPGDHLPEAPLKHRTLSVHEAPTREFAAHIEELAALSVPSTPTRAFAVHEARTREFAAFEEGLLAPQNAELAFPSRAANDREPGASGLRPRTRLADERRNEDATLKVGVASAHPAENPEAEALLRMLGASRVPPSRDPSPVHHVVTSSGVVPARRDGVSSESEPTRSRHKGR